MTVNLVVETGTGLADANSYVSTADADTYFANRANATWAAAENDAKAAALIQATQYVDTRFAFRGCRLIDTQALEWPRERWHETRFNWPVNAVINATCEAALRALSADLYTDTKPQVISMQKVGDIEMEYQDGARNGGQTAYPIIPAILRPFLIGGPHQIELVRG